MLQGIWKFISEYFSIGIRVEAGKKVVHEFGDFFLTPFFCIGIVYYSFRAQDNWASWSRDVKKGHGPFLPTFDRPRLPFVWRLG